MQHLVFHAAGDLRWEETPDPTIADPRDAIVAPLAVARCDLDPAVAAGAFAAAAPFGVGHEMVGRVVDRGDRAGVHQIGDLVIVPFQINCGECAMCGRGLTGACTAVPHASAFGLGAFGGVRYGGALADLVRVPYADFALIALPAGLDPIVAAGVPDNVSDGYRCVADPIADHQGEAVLVVGGLAQSVGLYAVASAIALDAEVVYADDDPARIAVARRLGATVIELGAGSPVPRDQFAITVDASATTAGRAAALHATRPCGTCTSVTSAIDGNDLPVRSMYMKGTRYEIGRVHARATAPKVLDLIARGRLDPGAVITRTAPFREAVDAMTDPAIKIVFVRD